MKFGKILTIALALALFVSLAAACGNTDNNGTANGTSETMKAEAETAVDKPAADDRKDWPEVLRYGVLPGENDDKVGRANKQFLDDMSQALGIKTELFVGEDYTAVIEAMKAKKLELGQFGPFSYIIANERSGAEAFAVRTTSPEAAFYHSLIVVPANSKVTKLEELKGKSFLFADPASTSGHLIPRSMFVKELGVKSKELDTWFGTVSFSGGHDKSIMAIAKGQADGAGVCDSCIRRVIDSGLVKESDFKVIATSEPIPKDPLAYRSDLPESLKKAIRDFILQYHEQNPAFFEEFKAKQYFPQEDSKYQMVRDVASQLEMSPEELLK